MSISRLLPASLNAFIHEFNKQQKTQETKINPQEVSKLAKLDSDTESLLFPYLHTKDVNNLFSSCKLLYTGQICKKRASLLYQIFGMLNLHLKILRNFILHK